MAICCLKNGIEIEYTEYGAGDKYLLCCQQGHSKVINWTRDLAEKHGFHTFDIVVRGFGNSSPVNEDLGDYWYDTWAQDACDFADMMNIKQFFYTGVSHGAGIGWHICVNHPERVKAFLCIVGGPHSKDGQETGEARMAVIKAAQTQESWYAFCDECEKNEVMERPEGISDDTWNLRRAFQKEQQDGRRNMPLCQARLNPRKPFAYLHTEKELIDKLSEIKLPVLMMGGMHDPICLPENMIRSCKAVKNSRLVIFEDASHGLDNEHVDEVVNQIMLFLDEKGLI